MSQLCLDSSWLSLEFKSCDVCFTEYTKQYVKSKEEDLAEEIFNEIKVKTAKNRRYDLRKEFPKGFILPLTGKRMSGELIKVLLPNTEGSSSDKLSEENTLRDKKTLVDLNNNEYYKFSNRKLSNQTVSQPAYYLKEFLYQQNQSSKLLHRIYNSRKSAFNTTESTLKHEISARDSSPPFTPKLLKIAAHKECTAELTLPSTVYRKPLPLKLNGHSSPACNRRKEASEHTAIWQNSRPSYVIYSSSKQLKKKINQIASARSSDKLCQ